ncbi:hypothetical protein TNIN_83931 [Trichonephila inaurata madagascariensis]|uniref:Uncharacterized protein n=1 Tax=Trichonephila inaurata madagascariensis TaxID=2747483 RepID=A0A8X6IW84_9ARAC|nr:hypothetical protein TNIN_83931 [Trichonephila inaurata madagascariensis]
MNKRGLASSSNSNCPLNKKRQESKESLQKRETDPYHLRPRNRVTKEAGSRSSGGEMHVWSRVERFKKPSPYNQSRHYRQQFKHQGRQKPEQNPRNGRSSRHSPGQSRSFRQQDRQETNGRPASRRTASLEVLIGDVKDMGKH